MTEIRVRNIGRTYSNGIVAVKNCSFQIASGQIVVVTGEKGCGKSTLLRLLAGLEELTDGEIWMFDHRVNVEEPRKRQTAMIFEHTQLFEHLTVLENLEFALHQKEVTKIVAEEKAKEMLKRLAIEELADSMPQDLEKTSYFKVMLARVLLKKPELLLLEEPLSFVPKDNWLEIAKLIREECHKDQLKVVCVSDDEYESRLLADTLMIMYEGEVAQIGTVKEVTLHPESLYIASFIGSPKMNLLEMKLELSAQKVILKGEQQEIELPQALANKIREGRHLQKDVVAGILPSAVKVLVKEQTEIENKQKNTISFSLDCPVSKLDYLENSQDINYCEFEFDGKKISGISENPKVFAQNSINKFQISLSNLYLFDRATGISIL